MAAMKSNHVETLTRFEPSQRVQHILLIISFSMLGLTGLPQSFARTGWAQAWMSLFGGIDGVRKVHHLFATLMAFVFFYHVIEVIGDLINKRGRRAMLPRRQDIKDARHSVSYLLGRRPDPPRYGRFDFRQKLEYWALIWGTVLMGATGLVLMFPCLSPRSFRAW
jgi:formate dehydrogenase subunit gamma